MLLLVSIRIRKKGSNSMRKTKPLWPMTVSVAVSSKNFTIITISINDLIKQFGIWWAHHISISYYTKLPRIPCDTGFFVGLTIPCYPLSYHLTPFYTLKIRVSLRVSTNTPTQNTLKMAKIIKPLTDSLSIIIMDNQVIFT